MQKMTTKQEIRTLIRQRKRALTDHEIIERSAALAQMFLATELYQRAGTIYGYMSFNQEVRTRPILERALYDGKSVAIPKVIGDEMVFISINSFDELAPGFSGIPEPIENGPLASDSVALVLMPGLAFDRQGHRIGYGGGFYDRFLKQEPQHPTIALCYDFQIFENIQTEEFDVPVDLIIHD